MGFFDSVTKPFNPNEGQYNDIDLQRLLVELGIPEEQMESAYKNKFDRILIKLDSYAKSPIDEEMIKEVFYIQDLIHEVSKNAR